jgi:hypothetical protein
MFMAMTSLISIGMFILYLAVIIYLILLFGRLVRAVETIARKIDSSSKT